MCVAWRSEPSLPSSSPTDTDGPSTVRRRSGPPAPPSGPGPTPSPPSNPVGGSIRWAASRSKDGPLSADKKSSSKWKTSRAAPLPLPLPSPSSLSFRRPPFPPSIPWSPPRVPLSPSLSPTLSRATLPDSIVLWRQLKSRIPESRMALSKLGATQHRPFPSSQASLLCRRCESPGPRSGPFDEASFLLSPASKGVPTTRCRMHRSSCSNDESSPSEYLQSSPGSLSFELPHWTARGSPTTISQPPLSWPLESSARVSSRDDEGARDMGAVGEVTSLPPAPPATGVGGRGSTRSGLLVFAVAVSDVFPFSSATF